MQGKDPSVEFTQDIVEESEDERCFDDMMTGSDSVPPIELPAADMGRLEEISELVNIFCDDGLMHIDISVFTIAACIIDCVLSYDSIFCEHGCEHVK